MRELIVGIIFHELPYFGTARENRLHIPGVRKKGIDVGVGDECPAADLDGSGELVDQGIGILKGSSDGVLKFLPVTADQSYSAVDDIDDPFHGFGNIGLLILSCVFYLLFLVQYVAQTG